MQTVTLTLSVTDPAALHANAVRAYQEGTGDDGDAEALAWLGSADEPDLERCVLEIVCHSIPLDQAGIEP